MTMKTIYFLGILIFCISLDFFSQTASVIVVNRNVISERDYAAFNSLFLYKNKENRIKSLKVFNNSLVYKSNSSFKKKRKLVVIDTLVNCSLINTLCSAYGSTNTALVYSNDWSNRTRYESEFKFIALDIKDATTINALVQKMNAQIKLLSINTSNVIFFLSNESLSLDWQVSSTGKVIEVNKAMDKGNLKDQLEVSDAENLIVNFQGSSKATIKLKEENSLSVDSLNITLTYTDRFQCVQEKNASLYVDDNIKSETVDATPCLDDRVDIVFPSCKDAGFEDLHVEGLSTDCWYVYVNESTPFHQIFKASSGNSYFTLLLKSCASEFEFNIEGKNSKGIWNSISTNYTVRSTSKKLGYRMVTIPEDILNIEDYDKFKINAINKSKGKVYSSSRSLDYTVVFSPCAE